MTPTVEYVESKIKFFNDLVFGSCLPPIPVKLSRARTYLGRVQFRVRRNLFGRVTGCTDFLMRISVAYDFPERELEDVILHEMIHYYIAWKGLRDKSAHGPLFRSYMNRINRDFGRNVRISYKAAQTDFIKDHERR